MPREQELLEAVVAERCLASFVGEESQRAIALVQAHGNPFHLALSVPVRPDGDGTRPAHGGAVSLGRDARAPRAGIVRILPGPEEMKALHRGFSRWEIFA